jgi:prepilin-type N-terminal cleavage/methylation domain-containing protein
MPRPRGLTLIELMVTAAIASVILAAAVAAAVALIQFNQNQGRRTQTEVNVMLAMSTIERRMSNAGLGYPNSRFAFRLHNNVPVGTVPNYDGSTTPVVVLNGPTAGIVAGTDVVEFSMSDSGLRRPGGLPGGKAGAVQDFTIAFTSRDPFLTTVPTTTVADPINQLVLFHNPDTLRGCQARVRAYGASTSVDFTEVNDSLTPVATNCPNAAQFEAFALERRVRFIIYQQANGVDLGLYQQTAGPTGVFGAAVEPVELGIINLQAAPVLGRDPLAATYTFEGCTVNATTQCVCNAGTRPPPGLAAAPCVVGDTAAVEPETAFIRRVVIELTGRAERARRLEEGRAVPSFDGPVAGAPDGFNRVQVQTSIVLANAALPTQ